MSRISLTACSFYFRRSYSKSNLNVYNLNGTVETFDKNQSLIRFQDIRQVFENFFNKFNISVNNDEKQKTFRCNYNPCDCGECDDFSYFYVTIQSGNYGSSSAIRDKDTNQVKYIKNPQDADEHSFVLFFVIPKDNERVVAQKGMLFFQNLGSYGVKTITTNYMRDYFRDNYNMSLICATISPELFINKLMDQYKLSKVQLVKNHKSSDSADNLSLGYGVETRELANLSFKRNKLHTIKNNILRFVNGKTNLFEFEGQYYDNAKFIVKIGDSQRTINLHNLDNLSIIEEVPDSLLKEDGNPDIPKLIDFFINTATEYLKDLVTQIE